MKEELAVVKKASSSIKTLLSKNGYSGNAIDKICKWYRSSTTNN